MSTEGGRKGHTNRKLAALAQAGEAGLPEDTWPQSEVVVPAMIADGLVKVVERIEPRRYLVITKKGRRMVE